MNIENIIEKLLSSDTDAIQQASQELDDAYKKPETIPALCTIMASHSKPEVRQYAATLLRKQLGKLRTYEQLPRETKQDIKNNMLNTMANEPESSVRGAMALFFGCVLRHEGKRNDIWIGEVLQHILTQCASSDARASEIGSFILARLADAAPEQLVAHFSKMAEFFQTALLAAGNAAANVSPTVMSNILNAMSALVPTILGYAAVKDMYKAAVPLVVQALNRFAADGSWESFTAGLDILENMVDHTANLLNPHVRLLMDYSLSVSSSTTTYSPEIRIRTLSLVNSILRVKKKMIVKLKLIEPILKAIFAIMAAEPEGDDADEFFTSGEEETPLSAAVIVLDTMALHMPSEKFIQPMLGLVQTALQNATDPLHRRAAYIALSTISEGCSEVICEKYLGAMLLTLKNGLTDPALNVRSAALLAVGQFSENLQPDILEYANDILPVLLTNMTDILTAHQAGQQLETKHIERLFYALEAFCSKMEDALKPFIEPLMNMNMAILNSDYPKVVQNLTMKLIEAAAEAYKGSLLQWFQPLVQKLQPLLFQNESDDPDMRSQAIVTLAALIRNTDQEFKPFASDTIQQCVQWIETSEDPDVRKSLLMLFSALASVVGEDFAPVIPVVLKHVQRCIEEASGIVLEANNDNASDNDQDVDEIDIDDASDGAESDDGNQYFGENPYLEAKEEAVNTIKELVEACPKALHSSMPQLFETLYKIIEDPFVDLRKCAIEAIGVLIVKWYELEPHGSIQQVVPALIKKLVDITRKEYENEVVIESQEALCELLSSLEGAALPTKELRDSIAQCVHDGLLYKYACLFCNEDDDDEDEEDDDEDSETDAIVLEGAGNLLAALGKAVPSQEFKAYFARMEPLLVKQNAKKDGAGDDDDASSNGYFLGIMGECYGPLGENVSPYFAKHLKFMMRGAKARNAKARQNAVYGLGELVRAAKEISYSSYPAILDNLSYVVANEQERVVLDNVIGALARLILTNPNLVPLDQVVPVMINKMPIVDDHAENQIVFDCFGMLFEAAPAAIQPLVGAVVGITIQSVVQDSFDDALVELAVNLLLKIRQLYPGEYQTAMASSALVMLLPLAQEKSGGRI